MTTPPAPDSWIKLATASTAPVPISSLTSVQSIPLPPAKGPLQPGHEALVDIFHRLVANIRIPAQGFPLLGAQTSGHVDLHGDHLIALAAAVEAGDTPTWQSKAGPGPGSGRHGQALSAFQGGDFQLYPQGGLGKANGHRQVDVLSLADKEPVGANGDGNIQVPRSAAVHAGMAGSGNSQPGAIVHPRGNFNLFPHRSLHSALAPTIGTGLSDDGACAATTGAGPGLD